MLVDGKQMRPIWLDRDTHGVKVLDQRRLPHEFRSQSSEKTESVRMESTEPIFDSSRTL